MRLSRLVWFGWKIELFWSNNDNTRKKFRGSWAALVSIWLKSDILITMVILKIFFRHSWAPIVSIWLENWISRTFIVSRGARLLQKFNLKLPFFQLQMIPKSKCDQRSMLFYLFFIFCIRHSKQMTIQSSLSLWELSCKSW